MKLLSILLLTLSIASNSSATPCDSRSLDFSEYKEVTEGLVSTFILDSMAYMLEEFLEDPSALSEKDFIFNWNCQNLGSNVIKDFDELAFSPTFRQLRALSTKYHLQNLNHHHTSLKIYPNLNDMKTQLDYTSWRQKTIDSEVKQEVRVIYRNGKNSVAETHVKNAAGEMEVRETEMILIKDKSKHSSFVVYDHSGKLATSSEFKNGVNADAPYVCMACHYDPMLREFNRDVR